MKNDRVHVLLATLLIAVIIVQGMFMCLSLRRIHTLNASVSDIKSQQSSRDALNALNVVSLSQPAVSVADNKVYLPDIHLALPLNTTTAALLYDSREVGSTQKTTGTTYDVTTRALATLPSSSFQDQFSCSPVRFSFEATANPYNPHEKTNTAVKLADGRMLQIYTYTNTACNAQWKAAGVVPNTITQAFEQATSY
ncbi:MAG: hypothetical protein ACQR33_01135 [Candidatus Saccharibacteria bacterium]